MDAERKEQLQTEIKVIQPVELHVVWPTIKQGLEIILKKSSQEWIPEDVYMSIKQGVSILIMGFVNGRYLGFVIVRPQNDCRGNREGFVWAFYAKKAVDYQLFWPPFVEFCAKIGCTKLTMLSDRKGWDRSKWGFEREAVLYSQKI